MDELKAELASTKEILEADIKQKEEVCRTFNYIFWLVVLMWKNL